MSSRICTPLLCWRSIKRFILCDIYLCRGINMPRSWVPSGLALHNQSQTPLLAAPHMSLTALPCCGGYYRRAWRPISRPPSAMRAPPVKTRTCARAEKASYSSSWPGCRSLPNGSPVATPSPTSPRARPQPELTGSPSGGTRRPWSEYRRYAASRVYTMSLGSSCYCSDERLDMQHRPRLHEQPQQRVVNAGVLDSLPPAD
jgi:hypothetical protein